MHKDSQAAIIANDLDSMIHRIEALDPHPLFTDALVFVQRAKAAISNGRREIHRKAQSKRFPLPGTARVRDVNAVQRVDCSTHAEPRTIDAREDQS